MAKVANEKKELNFKVFLHELLTFEAATFFRKKVFVQCTLGLAITIFLIRKYKCFKGSLAQNCQLQDVFMNYFPPGPSIPLGPFRICIKFVEIFVSEGYSRCQRHQR
jgi:hypothetical protein